MHELQAKAKLQFMIWLGLAWPFWALRQAVEPSQNSYVSWNMELASSWALEFLSSCRPAISLQNEAPVNLHSSLHSPSSGSEILFIGQSRFTPSNKFWGKMYLSGIQVSSSVLAWSLSHLQEFRLGVSAETAFIMAVRLQLEVFLSVSPPLSNTCGEA